MLAYDLMAEMIRRTMSARSVDRVALARDAWQQASYSLEAPELIPAGGMYSDSLADEPLPMPMTVERGTFCNNQS